jgi:hypothetical protein
MRCGRRPGRSRVAARTADAAYASVVLRTYGIVYRSELGLDWDRWWFTSDVYVARLSLFALLASVVCRENGETAYGTE